LITGFPASTRNSFWFYVGDSQIFPVSAEAQEQRF